MQSAFVQLKRHPRFVACASAVVLSGVLLAVFFEEARWNLVAEAWGVFGAGAVLWWLQEMRSEPIQRQAWLERQAPLLESIIDEILQDAACTAAAALGLPDELRENLQLGATREVRRAASHQAWASPYEGRAAERCVNDLDLPAKIDRFSEGVRHHFQSNQALLSRLPELEIAVGRYSQQCRRYLHAHTRYLGNLLAPDRRDVTHLPSDETRIRERLMSTGYEALALCDVCSDILYEAGVLPG